MDPILKKFKKIVKTMDRKALNHDNLVAVLYSCCIEYKSMETSEMNAQLRLLAHTLQKLGEDEADEQFYGVANLCDSYAERGFAAGLEVGIRFLEEIIPQLRG